VRLARFLEALPNRLALLVVPLIALALPGEAWGHATLLRTVPADGSVLAKPPATVQVFFDDTVRTSSGIKAVRNGGGSVLGGKPRAVGHRLVIPLQPGLHDGDYTVLWRVLSDDGHTLAGVMAFGVGSGRAPPVPSLTADNGPSVQDVLARFLFFAGLLTAAGAAFFRFAVGPVPVRLLLGAFLLVFIGVSGLVHDVSISTRFGSVMAAAAVIAGVGAMLAAIAPVYPRLEPLAFAAGLALLPVPTLAGHALDRGRPGYEPFVDFLHVAAASFWLGGLVALGLALSSSGDHAPLVRRFSNVAFVSVLVLAATGVLRAFAELSSVSQLWSTGYGQLLIVKTALLALLAAIGWVNRYRLVPRLSFAGLRRNVAVELTLFAVLIAAVALLTDLRPGRDRAAAAVATAAKGPPPLPARRMIVQGRESGDLAIALAVAWPAAELVALDQDGDAVNGLRVVLGGVEARSCGNGCYGAFLTPARRVRVSINGRVTTFRVPAKPQSADALVARATAAFRRLRSVEYIERLASSPRNRIVSHFTLERPNRLMYEIRGGADGIIIGTRRWDRARGGKWIPSPQDVTPEPEPIWGAGHVTNAYLLETTPTTYVVSFMNPLAPVWFTISLDRRTLLPRSLRMTAAAHFMMHRYTRFNGPRKIRAPSGAR
jgi:copper transport protein